MAAAGGAAEAAPLLAFGISLALFVAWLAMRGLLAAYVHTIGYLLERLAGALHIKVSRFDIDFGGPVRAIDNSIKSALAKGALKLEGAAGAMFHEGAVLQEWIGRELQTLAHETAESLGFLQHVHLPKWTRWAIAAAFPPLLIARLVRGAIAHELPRFLRHAKAEAHAAATVIYKTTAIPYLTQWQWIHRHWKGLTLAIAAAAALPLGVAAPWIHWRWKLRELDRDRLHIWRRLHRLEKLLGVTAFAGAMAAVLGLPNWRCLTRGNIGRTARALCGVPSHVLNDLLGLVVDFLVITDICQVVVLLNDAFALVEDQIAGFVGEVGSALCHGDYLAPPTLEVRAVQYPPLQGRSTPVEA